jgi:hypothetical protein
MNPRSGHCAELSAVLPELALGIADGEERARALEHLAGCPDCRRELEELSRVADELIALAPEREPPAGFEARVLERLDVGKTPTRPVRHRLRRLRLPAAALAAAAATVVAMTFASSSDRRLASQYRAALQGGHGQYFQSARLRAPAGGPAGTVFAYQGSPSWLFYVLTSPYRSGRYTEQIVTRSGKVVTLPRFGLVAASWGLATPVPVKDIARVRLIREPRGPTLQARLPIVER